LLQDGRAIVADFGIALSAAAAERATATGMSIGTPHYMSPEQALGQRNIDARTDVYALGVILYEMLTGAPPFTGANAQAIVAKVLTEKPVPPARLRRDVPAPLSQAVLTALHKLPDERFATAAAFQSAFAGSAPAARPRRRIWLGAAIAALVLLAAAGTTAYLHHRESGPAAQFGPGPARRIAVIPFRNANGDTQNTSFSEGLTLELNDALSRMPGLTIVVAASDKYRRAGMDVAAAGRELGVDAVLTGRVDTANNVVRVQVQLQDARTQALRWSRKYDRKLSDLYALEDTLSAAIAGDLQLAGAGEAQAAVARAGRTASPEAHALLVEARGQTERRTAEGLAVAATLFTAAINLDSSYAQAWAGRANTENLLVAFADQPSATLSLARADALRAIQLDSTTASPHATLGFNHVMYDRNWSAAGAEFSRAIALDSTAAPTRLFRAWYYMAVDQLDSAAASIRIAMRLDPAAPIYDTRLGTTLYFADNLAEAETALRGALRKDSTYVFARADLSEVYAEAGRCAEALRQLDPATARGAPSFEIAHAWARCPAGVGAARTFVAQKEAEFRAGQPVDGFFLARIYAGLGDEPKMFQWLDRAVSEHSWSLFMLRRNPAFKRYRDRPRFQQLVRDVYGS
ncbi:MAG: protein kinase, partial [Gemmatimonadota bacterium]